MGPAAITSSPAIFDPTGCHSRDPALALPIEISTVAEAPGIRRTSQGASLLQADRALPQAPRFPQRGRQAEHLSQTRQIEARVAGPPRYRGKSAKMARKRKSERPCREISTNCREVARSASGQKVVFLQSVNGATPWRNLLGARGQLQGGSRGPMDVTLGEGPS